MNLELDVVSVQDRTVSFRTTNDLNLEFDVVSVQDHTPVSGTNDLNLEFDVCFCTGPHSRVGHK